MFSEGGRETTVVDIHCHMTPPGAILAGQRGEAWHGIDMHQTDTGSLWWEMDGRRAGLTWENPDLGWDSRLAKMDQIGVDVQVMSLSPAMYWYGHLGPERSRDFAREANDAIAEAIGLHPTRFQGLAHLPLQTPRRRWPSSSAASTNWAWPGWRCRATWWASTGTRRSCTP